jgi:hypothetical protein
VVPDAADLPHGRTHRAGRFFHRHDHHPLGLECIVRVFRYELVDWSKIDNKQTRMLVAEEQQLAGQPRIEIGVAFRYAYRHYDVDDRMSSWLLIFTNEAFLAITAPSPH